MLKKEANKKIRYDFVVVVVVAVVVVVVVAVVVMFHTIEIT